MKQVTMNKGIPVLDQSCPAMAGSEAKNPLPANLCGIFATDLMGLSWVFTQNGMEKTNDASL